LWVLFLKEILHSKIILKSFKIFELWNAWVTIRTRNLYVVGFIFKRDFTFQNYFKII